MYRFSGFYNEVFMGDQPGETSRLEKINHVIRVVLGITALIVFIVGLIAFFMKRSGY